MLHRRRFRLYLLGSAIVLVIAAAATGISVGRFFERRALTTEEERMAENVRHHAAQHLGAPDFAAIAQGAGEARFAAFFSDLHDAFRVKAFDRTGRIVWSNEPKLVGQVFPGNPPLQRALGGSVVTMIRETKHAEHVYERANRYVAEVYVPIRFPGTDVVGVLETYRDLTGHMAEILATQRMIWAMSGGVALLLWIGLAAVVWSASASEHRAARLLEAQNAQIREAHERLAAILSGVADRMLIIDRDMRVVWMNAAAEEAAHGEIGQRCFTVFGAIDGACVGCPAADAIATGRVERGVRAERGVDGQTRYFDLVAAPLRDSSGGVYQVLEVARDITALVEMEERLKQSAARLEESHAELLTKADELQRANTALQATQAQLVEKERLAAVGEVVVGLHHAILNPLAGILGALQIVEHEPGVSEATRTALAEVKTELHRIEALVKRLPQLRTTSGTTYVGRTTMLDVERAFDDPPPSP